jgi:hypothetical protein
MSLHRQFILEREHHVLKKFDSLKKSSHSDCTKLQLNCLYEERPFESLPCDQNHINEAYRGRPLDLKLLLVCHVHGVTA